MTKQDVVDTFKSVDAKTQRIRCRRFSVISNRKYYAFLVNEVLEDYSTIVQTEKELESLKVALSNILMKEEAERMWLLDLRISSGLLPRMAKHVLVKGFNRLFVLFKKSVRAARFIFSIRCRLHDFLAFLNVDVLNVSVDIVGKLEQDIRWPGIFKYRTRNSMAAVLLAIDLIPAEDGFWFCESNLSDGSAFNLERIQLYSDDDPLMNKLILFAHRNKFKNLLLYGPNYPCTLDSVVKRGLVEKGRTKHVNVSIFDDVNTGEDKESTFEVREPIVDDSLVIRCKYYHTNFDFLVTDKEATYRILSAHMKDFRHIHIPETSKVANIPECKMQTPFPNLVVKRSDIDGGAGLHFFKVSSVDQLGKFQSAKPNVLFQPFIHKDLRSGEYFQMVRSHVLISPLGVEYVSAHRVVSGRPVPKRLDIGLVEDPSPFLVKFSAGAHYQVIDDIGEQDEVMKATLEIGEAYLKHINDVFVVDAALGITATDPVGHQQG